MTVPAFEEGTSATGVPGNPNYPIPTASEAQHHLWMRTLWSSADLVVFAAILGLIAADRLWKRRIRWPNFLPYLLGSCIVAFLIFAFWVD